MNYDATDCDWSWDDDYIVGFDGDIKDTSDDALRSLQTEISTVCKASLLDWEKDPTIGAQLSDFIGEANTRETGTQISNRIKSQIVAAKLVKSGDLSVRVVPIGIYRLLILIQVITVATANNKLTSSDPLQVTLVFDTVEQSVMVLPRLLPRLDTGDIY